MPWAMDLHSFLLSKIANNLDIEKTPNNQMKFSVIGCFSSTVYWFLVMSNVILRSSRKIVWSFNLVCVSYIQFFVL